MPAQNKDNMNYVATKKTFHIVGLYILFIAIVSSLWATDKDQETPKLKDQNYHWAFEAIQKPEVPKVEISEVNRIENEIDHFILAKLADKAITPSKVASPRILVRRIYFDLIGLPPTNEQIEDFLQEADVGIQIAVEKLVDRLLQSPHYGERWARHWLDVARYSDGYGGFQDNAAMNHAWRYRDWVVSALNNDLPYDQFLKMQIAGDLIGDSPEDKVATGFFAIGPTYKSDGGDPDSVAQAKSETLDDRIDTLTRGMLGLTVSCARCHDHFFDPVPQIDYYSLAGVFNNSRSLVSPISPQEIVDKFNEYKAKLKDINNKINSLNKLIKKEQREASPKEINELELLRLEKSRLEKTPPPSYESAHSLADSGDKDMHVAKRGNLRKPGELAPRQFLKVLSQGEPQKFDQGSGRVQLAEAIVSKKNPLTTRVFVNRVWMHHFGKAIVRSPSNFGDLGDKPTHPELLDWLAIKFIESNWSIKELHRLIMTSASYQMSSKQREDVFLIDGENELVWRMNQRRLEAESWRDTLLSVTKELDLTLGGLPYDDINIPRRTLYFKVSRNGDRFRTDNYLRLFDFPLMRATVAKRPSSIVPQQFLFLMNSNFMKDRARALSKNIQKSSSDRVKRINYTYKTLFGRKPNSKELEVAHEFFSAHLSNESENVLWNRYAQVLLSSNELMYVR